MRSSPVTQWRRIKEGPLKSRVLAALVAALLLVGSGTIPRAIQAATARSNQPFGLCSLTTGTKTQTNVRCPVLVIGEPRSATLVVYSETNHHIPLKTVMVKDRAEVTALADRLNHLHWYPRNVGLPCPMHHGPYVLIHFAYGNGDRWTVAVQSYGCGLVVSHGVGALPGPTDLGKYLAGLGATLPTP